MLALVVAILCLNPKVPRRTSEESNEDPNVHSLLHSGEIPQAGRRTHLGRAKPAD